MYCRARNRKHAQKSRDKKKVKVGKMEGHVKLLETENEMLKKLLIHQMGATKANEAFKQFSTKSST
jgi:hypothetical protein